MRYIQSKKFRRISDDFTQKSDKFGLTFENQLETELNIKRLKNEVKLSNVW